MHSFLVKYQDQIVPKMKEKFGYKNILAVPKIEKVVLNIGASKALVDSRFFDIMERTLINITGQKPVKNKAKKSISSFKIREGMVVGLKVTLRKNKMYDFLEKLINISLPRIRDFRGISYKSFDKKGNYSLGLREIIAFPEIRTDELENVHGLEIAINTTAKSMEEGKELLTLMGFPFIK